MTNLQRYEEEIITIFEEKSDINYEIIGKVLWDKFIEKGVIRHIEIEDINDIVNLILWLNEEVNS